MASPQILRPLISCYDTFSTNDPSFIIGCCQVRFSVLTFDHSATTYSALDVTHVMVRATFSWPPYPTVPGMCNIPDISETSEASDISDMPDICDLYDLNDSDISLSSLDKSIA